MIVPPGATSVSVDVFFADDTGAALTGKVAADFPACKWSGGSNTADTTITLTDLAAITTAHPNDNTAGGIKEREGGWYRLDLPNNMLTSAGRKTLTFAETTNKRIIAPFIDVQYTQADVRQLLGTAWLPPATPGTPDVNAKQHGGVAQTGGDIYPAVTNIGVTSAALNKTADSITITTGTETGTVANTVALDGTYDSVADVAGTVDFYYEATLPTTGGALTGVNWQGYVAGLVNTVKVYIYNWTSAGWDQVGSIVGIAGAINGDQDFNATNDHTGTGGNALKVRIRFQATGLTAASVKTDRVLFGYAVVPNTTTPPTAASIATTMWQDLLAGSDFGTAGSIGKLLKDDIDAAISSRMATFTLPANFSSLGINASGHVSRVVLVDTITTYTGNTPQTGDSFARIGVAGAGLTALGDVRLANLDAAVSSRLASVSYTAPDNADIVLIKAQTDKMLFSAASFIKSDLKQIDELETNDNLATLKLKVLSVISSDSDAVVFRSNDDDSVGFLVMGGRAASDWEAQADGPGWLVQGGGFNPGIRAIGGNDGGPGASFEGRGIFAGVVMSGDGSGPGLQIDAGATGDCIQLNPVTGLRLDSASVVEFLANNFLVDSGQTYSSSVAGSVVKEIADNATGGGGGSVDVTTIEGVDATDAITASVAAALVAYPVPKLADFFTVNSGQSYSTAVAGSVVKETADNAAISPLAAIQADTNDIQARLPAALVGGRMDSSVGAMAANVMTAAATAADYVAELQAGLSTLDAAGVRAAVGLASANLDTQLSTIDDFLDTEIAAIKAKTDNLPGDPASASSITASFSTVNATLATISGFIDTEIGTISSLVTKLEKALIKNKFNLVNVAGVYHLRVYDDDDTTVIYDSIIKDKDAADVILSGRGPVLRNRSTV